MAFSDTLSAGDIIRKKLSTWLENPPDYFDVKEAYEKLGLQRKKIRQQRRQIEEIEDAHKMESDKPRSNDTKVAILKDTMRERNILMQLEADLEEMETRVKFLEFSKQMYASASFQSRVLYD